MIGVKGFEFFNKELQQVVRDAEQGLRHPFITVVMAHKKALETKKDRRKCQEWKLTLTRRLYEIGYNKQEIINLFQFIDWVMTLPSALEQKFQL